MNKRIRNKIAKRKAEEAQQALANAPVTERVRTEVQQTVTHVLQEVKEEVVQRALEAEKKVEHVLEKVPLVGDAAAGALGRIAGKLQEKSV